MPFLRRPDGVEIHYEVEGAGPTTAVFLHGLAGHCGEWAETAAALEESCRTVRIDQRGHGHSSRDPADLSREAFADDVAAVIGEEPVTLVGQSMGAHTALVVAGRHPGLVEHLIMVEGDVGGGGPEPLAAVSKAIAGWPASFGSLAEVRDFFGGDNPAGHAWADGYEVRDGRYWPRFDPANVPAVMGPVFAQERWDIWDRLELRIDLVVAERSTIVLDEMCERQPRAGRHIVAGAGHDLHLDQPQRWIDVLAECMSGGGFR